MFTKWSRVKAGLKVLTGDDSADPQWFLGVGLALAGGTFINLGANFMKLSHIRKARAHLAPSSLPSSPASTLSQTFSPGPGQDACALVPAANAAAKPSTSFRTGWPWVLGIVFFVSGNMSNFTAASFTPATTLAAISSVQFVSNVLFARLVLAERVSLQVLVGTAVIIVGNVLMVTCGRHSSHHFDARAIQSLFFARKYLAYLAFVAVLSPAAGGVYRYGHASVSRAPLAAPWYIVKVVPTAYAVHCASIGTQTAVIAKSLALLVKISIQRKSIEPLMNWFPLFLLVTLLMVGAFWLRSLNRGLQLFPALVIVPILQMNWILFAVMAGGILFRELGSFTPYQIGGFMFGLLCLFIGVWLLTPARETLSADRLATPRAADRRSQDERESPTYAALQDEDHHAAEPLIQHRRSLESSPYAPLDSGDGSSPLRGERVPSVDVADLIQTSSTPSFERAPHSPPHEHEAIVIEDRVEVVMNVLQSISGALYVMPSVLQCDPFCEHFLGEADDVELTLPR